MENYLSIKQTMAIRSFKGKMELAVEEREKSHKQFANWIGDSLKTCFE